MQRRERLDWNELVANATDDYLRPELMFEGSCDFLRGWEILWAVHNSPAVAERGERSPIQACASCASMALELALKSLLALDKKEPPRSHSFAELFSQLSARSRSMIAARIRLDDRSTSVARVAETLRLCEGTFEKWRYKHEQRDLDFNQGHMRQVTNAVHQVVSLRLASRSRTFAIRPRRRRALSTGVVRDLIALAVERLRIHDRDLPHDVNERTWSHRLAVHLEREVRKLDAGLFGGGLTPRELSVDCEYNRHGRDPKRLGISATDPRAFPDIIVHRRGVSGPNVIAIEVKPSDAPRDLIEQDIHRLRIYRTVHRYAHAFLVLYGPGEPTIRAVHRPRLKRRRAARPT